MSQRRTKGSGSLRLRSGTWYIIYYVEGLRKEENTHTADRKEADRQLREKQGRIAKGENPTPTSVTVADLCQLVINDHELRELADLNTVKWRFHKHLEKRFSRVRAAQFGQSQVWRYIKARQKEEPGVANATLNRELSIIRRGYTLGKREQPPLVQIEPYIPKLKEDNAREGLLDYAMYRRLLEELPVHLKALFVCAYYVGPRSGELRRVKWDQIDWKEGLIWLLKTKNGKPRPLPIYGEMEEWLRFQEHQRPEGCQWVFNWRNKPVGAHIKGWREACERAGVPDLLFHDLRRSAVVNMREAGIPAEIRMKISGHLTRSMDIRYNIVDSGDLAWAKGKMEEHKAKQAAEYEAQLAKPVALRLVK